VLQLRIPHFASILSSLNFQSFNQIAIVAVLQLWNFVLVINMWAWEVDNSTHRWQMWVCQKGKEIEGLRVVKMYIDSIHFHFELDS
jgi:hypothetical protein